MLETVTLLIPWRCDTNLILIRPEMDSEPAHFLTFINNGKTFPSLVGMQLPITRTASTSTRSLASQKVLDFLRPFET